MASARKGWVPIRWYQYMSSEIVDGSIWLEKFSHHEKKTKSLRISVLVQFQYWSTYSMNSNMDLSSQLITTDSGNGIYANHSLF